MAEAHEAWQLAMEETHLLDGTCLAKVAVEKLLLGQVNGLQLQSFLFDSFCRKICSTCFPDVKFEEISQLPGMAECH